MVKNGCTVVNIGKNKQWKTSVNLGKRNNQNFTQVPHAKFTLMLTYKLEKVGITVKVGEESYTSKASLRPGTPEDFVPDLKNLHELT
ncbi:MULTISPECIES: IS200/IS605 family accessory protein TnpB-related protein [Brasilonema]|uniref:IS200/IS605 family accessory protein TnpB-related protein n=1 Tax=Brasilonema TaxID=383614 RepID=UPI001FE53F2E|nr:MULTISPECIES: IS200/IS605 family accessory protein TnpB-related protein [Brasilonema]